MARQGKTGGEALRSLELYLGRSRRAVYHLIEAGSLPCERAGRKILVRKADADRVMGGSAED